MRAILESKTIQGTGASVAVAVAEIVAHHAGVVTLDGDAYVGFLAVALMSLWGILGRMDRGIKPLR